MEHMVVSDIVEAVGGKLLCGNNNAIVTNVQIDSRNVVDGTLFVALVGEKTDAHKFINKCFEQGAVCCITQKKDINKNGTLIYVDNTLTALQKLGSWYRDKFNCTVIGITGSVGKTTTKEMIYSALSYKLDVMKTRGNMNSQIGLPVTILDIEKGNDCAVIEMGVSMFDEMNHLVDIAKPKCAVITNIGVSHIENFKTQENILKEKIKITTNFTDDSVLFINGDDDNLRNVHKYTNVKTITFGIDTKCDYNAENIVYAEDRTTFTMINGNNKQDVTLNVIGEHNVLNALASFAVGNYMGINNANIAVGLKNYIAPPLRQQIYKLDNNITLIDDSYNASPDSMRSAIKTLILVGNNTTNRNGKKIAILADMLELGDIAINEHKKIGEYLANHKIDCVITIGELAKNIVIEAVNVKPSIINKSFMDNNSAYEYVKSIIKSNDTILIKGSRGMKTDEIVKKIKEDF